MAAEAGFLLFLFYLQCTVLVVLELTLFDACTFIVVFFIYNMHTDWSCWSRSATKEVQKVAFFFSSILEAYRHSMVSSNRIQNIQNWPAQFSWKYMKVKPNEPTITVTVNTCQKYALKLASIGHFSTQRSTTIRIEQSTMTKDFLRGLHRYEI